MNRNGIKDMARERRCSAVRKVTVELNGWNKKVGNFSVKEAYWYVRLSTEIAGDGNSLVRYVKLFESESYERAKAAYDEYRRLVT